MTCTKEKVSINSDTCGEFDYVVVGAGSSGCVLASRLADSRASVLVLESGPSDRSIWFHIPVGYYRTVGHPKYDWGYFSEPEPTLNGRRLSIPRGRVVGGCGAINGLCYVRGQHADFDAWEALGITGWSWRDVEPFFKKLEGFREKPTTLGSDGPITLTRSKQRREICDAFLRSAQVSGLPMVDYFDGSRTEGFAYTMINAADGWRSSSSVAYLKPAIKRQGLRLETHAHCEAVVIENNKAVGVRFRKDGSSRFVRARREVILSAGVFNTPQILQLSGIGPADLLQSLGINVICNHAGVGQNLQEHFLVELEYRLNKPLSLNDDLRRPLWKIKAGLQWLFKRSGPLTAGPAPILGFARSHSTVEWPDLQFHFLPVTLDKNRQAHRFSAVGIDVYFTRPESRGAVNITSSSPFDSPSIEYRFLSTETDKKITVAGLRLARKIAGARPFSDYVVEEIKPGESLNSDDELLSFAREFGFSDYHPVGTCRMGITANSVVDHRLRVNRVDSLRIADCSILPQIVSANTNACAMMIAEKAAHMILEDAKG